MKKLIPKNIFSYLFPLLIFLIIWGSFWVMSEKFQKVKGISTTLSSSEIISLTNLERSKSLSPPLRPNEALSKAAQLKAEDMFDRDYFDHIDIDGNGSWSLIEGQDYQYLHAGENLARNFNSASSLLNAWIKSDSHRVNLLSKNYTDIGVAVLESDGQVYIVQILATPLPEGYIDSRKSGENFSFSSPISGGWSERVSSGLVTTSFFISLLIFLIGYRSMSKVVQKYLKFNIPDIKYWNRK